MSKFRELDQEIAERVMGWHSHTDYDFKPPEVDWYKDHDFQAHVNCEGQLEGLSLWSPSSDIAAAFQVRQRMRELGFTFRLSDADNGRSAVSFFHDDAEQGLAGAVVADTDALAICQAALQSV